MSKNWMLFLLIFILFASNSYAIDPNEDYDARLVAAKKYAATAPFSSMMDDMFENLAKRLPEEKRENFIKGSKQLIDYEKMEKIVLDTMIKYFNTEELNALADFYGSPTGQSILKKFPQYGAEVSVVILNEVREAIKKMKASNESNS